MRTSFEIIILNNIFKYRKYFNKISIMKGRYSTICPNCGTKSKGDIQFCPECSTEKFIKFKNITIYQSIVGSISKRINFVDNSERIIDLLFRLILIASGIFLINPIIESSKILWLFFLLLTIQSIIKEISFRIHILRNLYHLSRTLIYAFIGGGAANLIAYTGKNHNLSLYDLFSISVVEKEILSGNKLVIIGMITGVLFTLIAGYMKKIIKES